MANHIQFPVLAVFLIQNFSMSTECISKTTVKKAPAFSCVSKPILTCGSKLGLDVCSHLLPV